MQNGVMQGPQEKIPDPKRSRGLKVVETPMPIHAHMHVPMTYIPA